VNEKPDRLPRGRLPLVGRPILAQVLGCDPLTISRWEKETPPLPIAKPGGPGRATLYALPAVHAWWLARAEAQRLAHGNNGNARDHRDQAFAAQAIAQTERIGLSIAKMKSELVAAADIAEAWAEARAHFRGLALALPAAIAPEVVHVAGHGLGAVEAALTEAIRGTLTACAAWEPEPAGNENRKEKP